MNVAVIVPVFNEHATLFEVVARLDDHPLPGRTVYLVDDGSTDGSRELVERLGIRPDVRAIVQTTNGGKGSAVAAGWSAALRDPDRPADIILIHDADLEYDPADHGRFVGAIASGRADAVVGTRFHGGNLWFTDRSRAAGIHRRGNRILSAASALTTGLRLADMECCTKAFSRAVAERITIREPRFGLEPELIAKLGAVRLPAGRGTRRPVVEQIPVSYRPRRYVDGKKIGWRDGVRALYVIGRHARAARAGSGRRSPE